MTVYDDRRRHLKRRGSKRTCQYHQILRRRKPSKTTRARTQKGIKKPPEANHNEQQKKQSYLDLDAGKQFA